MKIGSVFKTLWTQTKKHSPKILGGLAIGGLGTTVLFAIKEAPVAKEKMDELRSECREAFENGEAETDKVPAGRIIREVVPIYIPTIGMSLVTTGCIIGSVVAGERQKTILSGAAASAELALTEYQNKVRELYGERKETAVRDQLAEDQIRRNPPSQARIYDTGRGNTLCFEPLTARYFLCDIDVIKRGEIEINRRIMTDMWASANELFNEWGLEDCELGEDKGWNPDHQVKLHFSSMLDDNQQPVLVIGYQNRPVTPY